MPMLTREMIVQQQMARNAARLSTPSTPSSHSTSRVPSLSSSPASTPRSLSRSPVQRSRDYANQDKCWTPNLDEVSRATPEERARLFARLAQEAERDAQYSVPRTPERKVQTFTSGHLPAESSEYSTAVIGAAALQPVRPGNEHPIRYSTPLAQEWSDSNDAEMTEIEYQQVFSEWVVDVPESPVTSSFRMTGGAVSEEVIEGWTKEDTEMETMERHAQNDKLRKLGYYA